MVYSGNISPSGNILSDYQYEYNRIRRINEFLYGLETYAKYDKDVVKLMQAQARFSGLSSLHACQEPREHRHP